MNKEKFLDRIVERVQKDNPKFTRREIREWTLLSLEKELFDDPDHFWSVGEEMNMACGFLEERSKR